MNRNAKWDFYKGMLIWGVVIWHMITALKAGGIVMYGYIPF